MKISITKKYLMIPVCHGAEQVRVYFKSQGELVFDLDIRLSAEHTDTVYYVDFERFIGKTLDIEGVPEGMADWDQADERDETGIYDEPMRPVAHFSAKQGWINDPNGCIKLGDTYHLYYQHNPCGRLWGNMHWGHATSKDLMHWEEHDIALFPDETGTMYSGSAWLDKDNVTGLGTKENPAVLFFYTAAGGVNSLSDGKPYIQCLAYSLDGGKTLIKYDKNPVLGHVVAANRDPLINYSEEMGCYIMALYYLDNEFALYKSDNLLDWEKTDQITLPDAAECPDFYKLKVEGEDKSFWVLTGAHDAYLVGELSKEGKFTPVQGGIKLHFGNSSYAAQSYSEIDDGRRIKIAWANGDIPGQHFNCAMTTPTEMTLKKFNDQYYLCTAPVKELELLYKDTFKAEPQAVKEGQSVTFKTEGKASDIKLQIKGGRKIKIHHLGQEYIIDNHGCYAAVAGCFMPAYPSEEGVKLRIVTDTHGCEVYCAEGQSFAGVNFVSNYENTDFTVIAEEGDIEICKLEISPLKNIWKE